jgi:hypothetical protein
MPEFEKLRSRFGPQVTDEYVERLSCYLKRHPRRKCYSAYATILTWLRTDQTVEVHTPKPAPLITAAEQYDRAICLMHVTEREGDPKTLDACLAAIKELDKDRRGFY